MTQPTIDNVVDAYVKLRDRKAQLKKEHDAKVAPIAEKMAQIEAFLLTQAKNQGVQSFKTEAGTAYKSQDTSVTVADKDAYLRFINENNFWHGLDVKANKTAVIEYMAEHDGDLPPGLNYRAEDVINVRRG
jgi:phosphopantetheine adenylyltransferase